jgi:phenylpyruvate tautomerase PptA (4-oxalocrotonate tautomerase family)
VEFGFECGGDGEPFICAVTESKVQNLKSAKVKKPKNQGGGRMPLVRISLRKGSTQEFRRAIADGVHQAMVEAIAAPPDDRFQVILECDAENLIYDPGYLGVKRSDKVVLVQITLSFGRKPGQKRALLKRMAELLAKSPGLRPEDLVINLVETSWENWSFGNGEAQYQEG